MVSAYICSGAAGAVAPGFVGRSTAKEGTFNFTSAQPAALLNLKGRGTLTVGSYADVVVFDPTADWIYSARETKSKSRNTPFDGWTMQGKIRWTISEGRIAYAAESA